MKTFGRSFQYSTCSILIAEVTRMHLYLFLDGREPQYLCGMYQRCVCSHMQTGRKMRTDESVTPVTSTRFLYGDCPFVSCSKCATYH